MTKARSLFQLQKLDNLGSMRIVATPLVSSSDFRSQVVAMVGISHIELIEVRHQPGILAELVAGGCEVCVTLCSRSAPAPGVARSDGFFAARRGPTL